MRKFITFVVDLILVALAVGWWLMKAPEAFDPWIPWIVTCIVAHILYEFVWESDAVKGWRSQIFDRRKEWGLFALLGIMICVSTWFVVRHEVKKMALSQHTTPSGGGPGSTVTTIIQNSDGTCTNIVGGHDVEVECPR